MVGRLKNMVKNMLSPEKVRKLRKWQDRFEIARTAYSVHRQDMDMYEDYYDGTRAVRPDPNTHITPKKKAKNVRNIVYELIESQVDNSIPMPKVRAIHPEDTDHPGHGEAAFAPRKGGKETRP